MAMDFPASPTLNQVFGGYQWDGEKWINLANTPQTLNGTGQIVGTTGAAGVNFASPLAMTSATTGVVLYLNKAAGAFSSVVSGLSNSNPRWNLVLGDTSAESGSNAGSNFALNRYTDAGGAIDSPISVNRATGQATFTQAINAPNTGFRNRIINGDFRIDQWNNAATITPLDSKFVCDRWRVTLSQASKISTQVQAQSVGDAASTGVANHLYATTAVAYTPLTTDSFLITQPIEWFNFYDLSWGTIYAQPVTLSFWAVSSITGTHSGSLRNGANNRSYPFSFNIPTSGFKTKIIVTIPGDTTGAWSVAGSALGVAVSFNLGCGPSVSGTANAWVAGSFYAVTGAVKIVQTLNAYLQITGVQLEAGSVATAFEWRPFAEELRLCQRYYISLPSMLVQSPAASTITTLVPFPTSMRFAPTIAFANVVYTTSAGLTAQSPNFCNFGAQITASAASGYCTFTATANAEI